MGEKDMRRSLCLLAMLVWLLPSLVSAHIVNEQNLYDDLQYSKATSQIVYLSGLGVIPYDHHGSTLFSPQEKLTREELAYWAGTFGKLQESGAARTEVTAAALAKGLVPSLDGNATYADVNQAYFAGKLAVQDAGRELTREQFALFVFEHRKDEAEGKSLYDRGGFLAGPTGKVDKVSVREEKDAEGKAAKVYSLTVSGASYDVSAHPRVLQAAVDPAEWEGRAIQEAWLMNVAGKSQPQLQLIQFEQSANASAQPEKAASADHAHEHAGHEAAASSDESGSSLAPLVIVIVLLVLVGGFLFTRKRK
ncbi:hypothetical protein KM924_12670 [Brevibacillus parabrevis]|nr:hypothetical protein [Brevibacillus parabrevis]